MRLIWRSPTHWRNSHSYLNRTKQVYSTPELVMCGVRRRRSARAPSGPDWWRAGGAAGWPGGGAPARRGASRAQRAPRTRRQPHSRRTWRLARLRSAPTTARAPRASLRARKMGDIRSQHTKSTHQRDSVINVSVSAHDGMPFETDYLIGYELDYKLRADEMLQ